MLIIFVSVWFVAVLPGIVGHAMEGVGEDEKAYNYICSLDKVNLGGPGWFNDVFKVSSFVHVAVEMGT